MLQWTDILREKRRHEKKMLSNLLILKEIFFSNALRCALSANANITLVVTYMSEYIEMKRE